MRTCTVEEVERLVAAINGELIDEAQKSRADLSPIETGMTPKLPVLTGLKAVLFDIYGTLLISAAGEVGSTIEETPPASADETNETRVFAGVLKETGLSPAPRAGRRAQQLYYDGIQQIHELLKSRGVAHPEVNIVDVWLRMLEKLIEEGLIRDLHELPTAAVRAAFRFEISANVVCPMPGAAEIVQELAGRGLTLGIVSNAQFYTPLVIEALLGAPVEKIGFADNLCVWSWKLLEAKPSLRLFEQALERLRDTYGITADEVLYVGNDMRNDIRPSKELGCATALFAGDRRSLRLRPDEASGRRTEPDATITHLEQLSQVVPGRRSKDA